jgi:hypothetical protein
MVILLDARGSKSTIRLEAPQGRVLAGQFTGRRHIPLPISGQASIHL